MNTIQEAKILMFDLILDSIDNEMLKEHHLKNYEATIQNLEEIERHKQLCDILTEFESVKNLSVKDVIDIQNINEQIKKINVFEIKTRLSSLAKIKN